MDVFKTILGWVSDSRRLRIFLLSTVAFGLIAWWVEEWNWFKEIKPLWFSLAKAAGVAAGLVVLIAVGDAAFLSGRGFINEFWERRKGREVALRNFRALEPAHERCFLYLKQQNKQRFIDESYAMLGTLVGLGVLKDEGGTTSATVYEVPAHIWKYMHEDNWGDGAAGIGEPPWYPTSWRI